MRYNDIANIKLSSNQKCREIFKLKLKTDLRTRSSTSCSVESRRTCRRCRRLCRATKPSLPPHWATRLATRHQQRLPVQSSRRHHEFDVGHQQRPGTMIRKPNPTNPTPMIVADEFTPRERVMTSGTLPTTARLPPTPINTSGVVSSLP